MGRVTTAEIERALAVRIRAAEEGVFKALRGVAAFDRILGARRSGRWKTDAEIMTRLGSAIEAVRAEDPDSENLGEAVAAWAEAERLRWVLALTAVRVLGPEAQKIARAVALAVEDLVAEGRIGLYDAAVRFDPERNIRFSTYARWWARARMTRAVDNGGRPVKISGVAVEQRRRLRQVERDLMAASGSAPLAEMAEVAGVSKARARELLDIGEVHSLDDPMEEGGETSFGDVMVSPTPSPEDAAAKRAGLAQLRRAFDRMKDARGRLLLELRYGLDGSDPVPLAAIGAEMGLSRESARKIEGRALAELRGYVLMG